MSNVLRNNLREIDKIIEALQVAYGGARSNILGCPSDLSEKISLACDEAKDVKVRLLAQAYDQGLLELKEDG